MSKSASARKPAASKGRVSPFAAAMTVKGAKADVADGDGDDDDKEQREGESDKEYAERMRKCDSLSDEEKQAADESDEDYAKRMRGEPGEDGDPEASDPKEDEEKKAAARAEGVTAERSRWETVLKHPSAAGKGAVACEMLAGTDLTAERVISALGGINVTADGGGLAERMARNRTPAPSAAAPAATLPGADGVLTANMITSAAAKARGEAPRA